MSGFSKQKTKQITLAAAPTSGVAFGNTEAGIVSGLETLVIPTYRTKLSLQNLVYTVSVTSGGGAADGQGQKIFTFPEGNIRIAAIEINGNVTTGAGVSSTTAVISLGSAAAGDAGATLTGTEADIMASATLGDGTLAAATAESIEELAEPVSTVFDGTTTPLDVYLNIAGSWVHASGSTGTVTLSALEVIVTWQYLGDN